jgi:hypothetical protein
VLLKLVGEGFHGVKDGRVGGHEFTVRLGVVLGAYRLIGPLGGRFLSSDRLSCRNLV